MQMTWKVARLFDTDVRVHVSFPFIVIWFVALAKSKPGSLSYGSAGAGSAPHLATEVFLGEQDGLLGDWGMNNLYLYRPADSTRFSMIPWDKSQTFSDGPSRSIWRNITDQPPDRRNRLVMQILADEDRKSVV